MNEIDVNKELSIIENALREIISFALNIKYGDDWLNYLKLDKEKVAKWSSKKIEEAKKFRGELIENRLIYYSEFYELLEIIVKHWDDVFLDVFKKQKEIEVLLDIIASYRITIAHNRELKEHQKHFLIGASGIIRHMITEYRADRDNEDSYYPKFENIFINDLDMIDSKERIKLCKKKYHVDDEVEVIVNVICPPDVKITYAIVMSNKSIPKILPEDFSESNRKKFKLKKEDIPGTEILISVKSDQDYHRHGPIDLHEEYRINVLPKK